MTRAIVAMARVFATGTVTMLKLAYKVHKWLGLSIVALILLQSISGLMIAYRWDLARLIDASGMTSRAFGRPAPLDSIVAAAQSAFPEATPRRMMFPERTEATYFVHMQRTNGDLSYVSIDVGSAAILRAGGLAAFPVELAFEVHHGLMAGKAGRAVVGLAGILLVVLIVVGFTLWLPRSGGLKRGLRMQLRGSVQRATLDLHRVPGAIVSALMLLTALTGALIALQPLFAASASAPKAKNMPSDAPPWSIEDAVAQARTVYPDSFLREVRWPSDGTLWLLFRAPEIGARALHIVVVQLDAKKIVEIRPAQQYAGLTTYVLPFHTGEQFGAFGRAAMVMSGAVLLSMAITGLAIWLQRRRARRKMRRNAVLAEERA